MEKNQNIELNISRNQNLEELIKINFDLDTREENIDNISQEIQIKRIKEDAVSICKMCMDEKCLDINKNLCSNCNSRVKNYRFSNTLFISGCIIGSSVSGIGFSLNSLNIISFGLCLGIFLQNIYNFTSFFKSI